MKQVIPSLFIDDCDENLTYYLEVFGGDIKNKVPWQGLPGKLMHAELHINDDCILYFADREEKALPNKDFHIFLSFKSAEEIRRVYETLKETGTVIYELQKTFWGAFHGVVTDKNGITWELNREE